MDRLIKLEPSNQVVIRIEPRQPCRGMLTLRNVMHTMPVAFRLSPLNRTSYKIRPQTAIMPPLSTLTIEITYLPPPPIPDPIPRSGDSFYLESVICAGATSTAHDAVPSNWFDTKKKHVFMDSCLRIFFVGSIVLARLIEDGEMEKARDVLERSDPNWRAVNSTDDSGRTLLHIAIACGRADLVQLLIEFSADLEATYHGRSPLEAAAAYGHTIIAELLLARGVSTHRGRNTAGKTAYDVVEEERMQRFFDVMRAEERLMKAARRGDVRELSRAIEIGASVDARNGSGWTALMVAAYKGWMEVIRVLLVKGADIDARDEEGYTALHCAVEAGQVEAIEVLVKCGVDLGARTRKGKTVVEIAGALGYVGIVRMLVREGAAEEEFRPKLMEKKKNGNRCSGDGGGNKGLNLRTGFIDRTVQCWWWRTSSREEIGRRVFL